MKGTGGGNGGESNDAVWFGESGSEEKTGRRQSWRELRMRC